MNRTLPFARRPLLSLVPSSLAVAGFLICGTVSKTVWSQTAPCDLQACDTLSVPVAAGHMSGCSSCGHRRTSFTSTFLDHLDRVGNRFESSIGVLPKKSCKACDQGSCDSTPTCGCEPTCAANGLPMEVFAPTNTRPTKTTLEPTRVLPMERPSTTPTPSKMPASPIPVPPAPTTPEDWRVNPFEDDSNIKPAEDRSTKVSATSPMRPRSLALDPQSFLRRLGSNSPATTARSSSATKQTTKSSHPVKRSFSDHELEPTKTATPEWYADVHVAKPGLAASSVRRSLADTSDSSMVQTASSLEPFPVVRRKSLAPYPSNEKIELLEVPK